MPRVSYASSPAPHTQASPHLILAFLEAFVAHPVDREREGRRHAGNRSPERILKSLRLDRGDIEDPTALRAFEVLMVVGVAIESRGSVPHVHEPDVSCIRKLHEVAIHRADADAGKCFEHFPVYVLGGGVIRPVHDACANGLSLSAVPQFNQSLSVTVTDIVYRAFFEFFK